MSRAFCYQCRRAKVACLCERIDKQPNRIKIYVLQHPEETNNPKGSAIIAELGLQQYKRWVGEDFSQHVELNELLADQQGKLAILYPSDEAEVIDDVWAVKNASSLECLLIIDGTWRKAKKIWELTPALHDFPAIKLNEDNISDYRIRKVPQQGYLSTVECIVEGLRKLENCPQGYQPLLDLFSNMIDFQIGKMGKQTYQKNYRDK